MMATRAVSEYLLIKERKVYDLIRRDEIPCARVSGKLLFPRDLIDRCVLHNVSSRVVAAAPVTPVIASCHAPLLDWAVRESGSSLAFLSGGSRNGMQRVAAGEAALYRLGFVPLHRERFDVVIRRQEFFEPPVQAPLNFARTPAFVLRAGELGGYDISALG